MRAGVALRVLDQLAAKSGSTTFGVYYQRSEQGIGSAELYTH